ncbi:MAG: hypothetical protein ACLVL7_07565 [Anaerotruncus massiliensis (ex Togo et al. 2019)]
MKRSVLACALALACALSLAAPALAAEKAPSLAGDSKTTAVAKVYEYDPHRYLANGNSVYGNTLTVAADERVYDDSGKLWRVTDSSVFYDSSAFRCSVKTTANAMNARSVRQSDEPIVGAGACFVVTLSKDGMYDNTGIGFTVTYTAVKDTALPVSPLGANTGTASELAVKSGAKIVIDYTLRITEDTLFPSSPENQPRLVRRPLLFQGRRAPDRRGGHRPHPDPGGGQRLHLGGRGHHRRRALRLGHLLRAQAFDPSRRHRPQPHGPSRGDVHPLLPRQPRREGRHAHPHEPLPHLRRRGDGPPQADPHL